MKEVNENVESVESVESVEGVTPKPKIKTMTKNKAKSGKVYKVKFHSLLPVCAQMELRRAAKGSYANAIDKNIKINEVIERVKSMHRGRFKNEHV